MTMSVVQVGLILIGTFFLLLALSVPVSISLIVSSVLTTACVMDLDLATFVASQKMITGVGQFFFNCRSFLYFMRRPYELRRYCPKAD